MLETIGESVFKTFLYIIGEGYKKMSNFVIFLSGQGNLYVVEEESNWNSFPSGLESQVAVLQSYVSWAKKEWKNRLPPFFAIESGSKFSLPLLRETNHWWQHQPSSFSSSSFFLWHQGSSLPTGYDGEWLGYGVCCEGKKEPWVPCKPCIKFRTKRLKSMSCSILNKYRITQAIGRTTT